MFIRTTIAGATFITSVTAWTFLSFKSHLLFFPFPLLLSLLLLLLHQPKASTFLTFNATQSSLSLPPSESRSLAHTNTQESTCLFSPTLSLSLSLSLSLTVALRNLHVFLSLVDGVNKTEFTGSRTGEDCRAHE